MSIGADLRLIVELVILLVLEDLMVSGSLFEFIHGLVIGKMLLMMHG